MSTKDLTPESSGHEGSSFTPVAANTKANVKPKATPKAKAGKTTADDVVASSKTGPIMILCEIAFAQDKKIEVCLQFQYSLACLPFRQVNWARIAEKGSYKNSKSARDTWGQLKKKLYKEHGLEGEHANADDDKEENPTPTKAAKRKAPNGGAERYPNQDRFAISC